MGLLPRSLAILAALALAPAAVAFVAHRQRRSLLRHNDGTCEGSARPSGSGGIHIALSTKDWKILPTRSMPLPTVLSMARSYGPPEVPTSDDSNANRREQLKSEFTSLIHQMLNVTADEEYPSLLTQNVELIFQVLGAEGEEGQLLEDIIREDVERFEETQLGEELDERGSSRLEQVSEAVDLILSFVETFVEQTKSMDDVYKNLLGKIFTSIAGNNKEPSDDANASTEVVATSRSASEMENQLDQLLSSEKEAFTPGFLRHVEGECARLSSLPQLSPDSARMLQILRVIQARILEELGQGIGEGAVVLGQLLGYEDENERLAVLEAGLAVRGVDFAHELAGLTEEALEGFRSVPGGADPGLVKGVEAMDERIREFIGRSSDFQ